MTHICTHRAFVRWVSLFSEAAGRCGVRRGRRGDRGFLMGESVSAICRGLESDGVRTVRGCTQWSDSTVRSMLQNEKYIGDALLQKTYISDIFTRQSKKNHGELPQYYVHDCHPAIIDRETFQKVQEELARRGSLRKRSSKAKTEQGHYSGKYALSELLICGECGSTYRRQVYVVKGQNVYVWRCLNRLENGKRICKQSPTYREADLHTAIVAAINSIVPEEVARTQLRESIVLALAAKEPTETLPSVESQIRSIEEKQRELLELAAHPGAGEEYDEELGRLHMEKTRLMGVREELLYSRRGRSELDRRMDRISDALTQMGGTVMEYDDAKVRQLISHIKAVDKKTLLVCFKDGTEVAQAV